MFAKINRVEKNHRKALCHIDLDFFQEEQNPNNANQYKTEIGFENFTFKKLGEQIGSNESSIYRYFESKHKLMLYLSSWYWAWIEYRLVFATNNINNPLI